MQQEWQSHFVGQVEANPLSLNGVENQVLKAEAPIRDILPVVCVFDDELKALLSSVSILSSGVDVAQAQHRSVSDSECGESRVWENLQSSIVNEFEHPLKRAYVEAFFKGECSLSRLARVTRERGIDGIREVVENSRLTSELEAIVRASDAWKTDERNTALLSAIRLSQAEADLVQQEITAVVLAELSKIDEATDPAWVKHRSWAERESIEEIRLDVPRKSVTVWIPNYFQEMAIDFPARTYRPRLQLTDRFIATSLQRLAIRTGLRRYFQRRADKARHKEIRVVKRQVRRRWAGCIASGPDFRERARKHIVCGFFGPGYDVCSTMDAKPSGEPVYTSVASDSSHVYTASVYKKAPPAVAAPKLYSNVVKPPDRLAPLERKFSLHPMSLDVIRKDLSEVHDELSEDHLDSLLYHTLVGAFECGCCALCVASIVVPQLSTAAAGAVFALRACEHAHDVAFEATHWRSGRPLGMKPGFEVESTMSTDTPLGASVGALCQLLSPHITKVQLLNVLTAVAAFIEHPDSWSNRLNVCSSFISGCLANQDYCVGMADEIYGCLFSDLRYEPTMFGARFTLDDVSSALLTGEVGDALPKWIGSLLWIVGRILGLSTSASLTTRLFPMYVLQYCQKSKTTMGSIIKEALDGAYDLVCRCNEAWRLKSIEPFFTEVSHLAQVREANALCHMSPADIPGVGEGQALIISRLHTLRKAEKSLIETWMSLPYGNEKGQALRALSLMCLKIDECMKAWYAPTGRPRPFNAAIVGLPGLGKTFLTTTIFRIICALHRVPYDDYMWHSHEGSFEFWDDYDPRLQRFIIMDEVGAMSKDKVDNNIYSNLLKLLGEAPFNLPMADLNKIGKFHAAQYATVLTSNVPDLGCDGLLAVPTALFRRLGCRISIGVHPDSAKGSDSVEIDASKLSGDDPEQRLWLGKIEIPVVLSEVRVRWVTVHNFSSVREFIRGMIPIITAHFDNNTKFADGSAARARMIETVCADEGQGVAPLAPLSFEDVDYSKSMREARQRMDRELAERTVPRVEVVSTSGVIEERVYVRNRFGRDALMPLIDNATDSIRFVRDSAFLSPQDYDWSYCTRGWVAYSILSWWQSNPYLWWFALLLAVAAVLKYVWASASDAARRASSRVEAATLTRGDIFQQRLVAGVDDIIGSAFLAAVLPYPLQWAFVVWRFRHVVTLNTIRAAVVRSRFAVVAPVVGAAFGAYALWLRCRQSPSRPKVSVESTSGEAHFGMTYDEYRDIVQRNPVSWMKELEAKLSTRRPELDKSWREEAMQKVILSSVSKELLPRAITEQGAVSLIREVQRATYAIEFHCKPSGCQPETRTGTLVAIGRSWFLGPWHLFRIGNVAKARIRLLPRAKGEDAIGERWYEVTVGVNAARVDETDVAVLNLPILPATSLKDYFITVPIQQGQPTYGTRVTVFRPTGTAYKPEQTFVSSPGNYDDRWERGELAGRGVSCHLACSSQKGMSGSFAILEAQHRGAVIGGLVVANDNNFSPPSAVVDLVRWPQIEATMRGILVSQTGILETTGLDFSGVNPPQNIPHYKSWLRNFEGSPKFVVLGSSNKRVTYRQRFRLNPLTERMPRLKEWVVANGGTNFVVPPFKPFLGLDSESKLTWYDPQLNKVSSMKGTTTLPPELLKLSMHEYISGLPDMSGQPGGRGPLTWDQAVFGCSERGVPPLDLSKSAGLDGGSKYNHVDAAARTLSADMRRKVEEIDAQLHDGRLRPSEFASMLKAELRKVDKAMRGGTRHICPTSFAMLIVQRAYFAPIVLALLRTGVRRSWMAMGMNAADPRQWGKLAAHLLELAPDGILSDGDFQSMDAEEGPDSRQIEAAIAGGVAKEIGYDASQCAAVEYLVYCGGFCLIHLDGILILVFQGRPSGEFATDFFTCLALFILLCCAYYMCAAKAGVTPRPFRDAVFIPAVGDDHLRSQLEETRSWFNTRTIHEVLLPTGHVYTTAAKTLDFSDDFKPISEVVFLQRRIVPVQYKGETLYSAPLGLDRVAKSMHVIPERCSVTDAAHCESVMLNAQRELFLHGRASFDDFTGRISADPFVMPDGSTAKVKILSYERLFDEWVTGGMRTFDSGGQFANPDDVARGEFEVESTNGVVQQAIGNLVIAACVYSALVIFEVFVTTVANIILQTPFVFAAHRTSEELERASASRRRAEESMLVSMQLLGFSILCAIGLLFARKRFEVESTSGTTVDTNAEAPTPLPSQQATTGLDVDGDVVPTVDATASGVAPTIGGNGDWFRRITLLNQTVIASTSTNSVSGVFAFLNPFDLWCQNVPMLRKWANNRILRGGKLRVYVQVAATPLHRGAMVIGFAPCGFSFRQGTGNIYSHQVVQMNGRVRNISGAFTETFDVPLLNCSGRTISMIQSGGLIGTQSGPVMYIALLAPLTHCSLATAPSVTLFVRASLEEGNFYSPTDLTAYTVTMGKKDEVAEEGVFSRPARIVSDLAKKAAMAFPVIAPYALPFSVIAKGAGDLAAAFGFGRPTERMAPQLMAQAPNADLAASNVRDPIFALSTDSAATTSPSPSAGGWPNEDHMDLRFLMERWAIVGGSSLANEWSTSAGVGAILMTVPVSPYTVDAGSDSSLGYCPQPVSVVGFNASFWRGRAEVRVVVFAGALDLGRLRVIWVPGQGTSGATLDGNHYHSCMIDISETTECTMDIGWCDFPEVLSAPVTYATLPATAYAGASYSTGTVNGVVLIQVDSVLVSNQATTAIGVKVFMRWKELAFCRPSVRLLNNLQYTSGTLEVPQHGDVGNLVYVQSEKIDHLRQLLTRYWWTATFSPFKQHIADTSATCAFVLPAWSWSGSAVPTKPPNLNWRQRGCTAWDYAVKCYSVYRGGSKTRFVTAPAVQSNILQWTLTNTITGWSLYGTISNLVCNIAANATGPGLINHQWMLQNYDGSNTGQVDGTGTSVFKGTGELAGAFVPYRDVWPWRYTQTGYGIPANTDSQTTYDNLLACCSLTDTQTTNLYVDTCVEMWRAYGDDIVLHGFVCCPIISSGLWPNH